MSITTYSELQAAIGRWLHRSDLASAIPDFITLAEVRFNRDLRLNAMETQTTVTLSAGAASFSIPSDLIDLKLLTVTANSTEHPLRYRNLLDVLNGGSDTGIPQFYAGQGNTYRVTPVADAAYTLNVYYCARIPALTDAAPTNWMLTNAPDVYLYGALLEASPYLIDDERLTLWKSAYDLAVQTLQTKNDEKDYPDVAMQIRGDVRTW